MSSHHQKVERVEESKNNVSTLVPDDVREWSSTPIVRQAVDANNHLNFAMDEGLLQAFYSGRVAHATSGIIHLRDGDFATLDQLVTTLPPFRVTRSLTTFESSDLDLLIEGEEWLANVTVRRSLLQLQVGSARSHEHAASVIARAKATLGYEERRNDFTSYVVLGFDLPSFPQRFDNVAWEKVAANYGAATKTALNRLMTMPLEVARRRGRVILFHGPPGTGKTWAIRALLTEWRESAMGAYLLDPEVALNNMGYFLDIISFSRRGASRVVIIEDADFIIQRTRSKSSGLSRILNLADGMIGADHDVIVLLSANSLPEQIDEALLRPGRSLATIGFERLTPAEAGRRLGLDGAAPSEMSLAEVYAQVDDVLPVVGERREVSSGTYL